MLGEVSLRHEAMGIGQSLAYTCMPSFCMLA